MLILALLLKELTEENPYTYLMQNNANALTVNLEWLR